MTTMIPEATEVRFTGRDLTIHTFATWALFMVVAMVWVGQGISRETLSDWWSVFSFAIAMVSISSLILCWIGAVPAALLARALRSVPSIPLHVVAFGLIGFVACLVLVLLMPALTRMTVDGEDSATTLGLCALSGVCCAGGRAVAAWRRSARESRSLRRAATSSS